MNWWVSSTFLLPCSFVMLVLRDVAPPWVAVTLSNTMIAASLACVAIAIEVFQSRPRRRLHLWALVAAVAICTAGLGHVLEPAAARLSVVAGLLAALLACGFWNLYRRPTPDSRSHHIPGRGAGGVGRDPGLPRAGDVLRPEPGDRRVRAQPGAGAHLCRGQRAAGGGEFRVPADVHRTQPARTAARRRHRLPHRLLQPPRDRAARGPRHCRGAPARHAAGGAGRGHRPLQAHQRRTRPCRRRPGPGAGGHPHPHHAAHRGHPWAGWAARSSSC